jgi:OFA family oxalate/formate antiporter-like MFS transporter
MWMSHYKALGLSLGLSAGGAAFLVSLTAVGSGLGRVAMGWASDRIGRFPSLLGATLLELAVFLALGFGLPATGLYPLAALAGFAFGTWLALYGPTSTDLFGMRAAGAIYGFLYLSYGLGGLLGPMVGGLLADLTGGYRLAFFVMAGACALGALLFGAAALMKPPHFPHPPALEEEFPV